MLMGDDDDKNRWGYVESMGESLLQLHFLQKLDLTMFHVLHSG